MIFVCLIINYIYLTRMSFSSPLSLFSLTFAIKQIIKKKIQSKSGLWMFKILNTTQNWVVSIAFRSMAVQLLRIIFSFLKKIHANFNIILSFPELSG